MRLFRDQPLASPGSAKYILMRHFIEISWWDILMRHFYETFWLDILMIYLMRNLDYFDKKSNETFWWYILMINLDETFWWMEISGKLSLICVTNTEMHNWTLKYSPKSSALIALALFSMCPSFLDNGKTTIFFFTFFYGPFPLAYGQGVWKPIQGWITIE